MCLLYYQKWDISPDFKILYNERIGGIGQGYLTHLPSASSLSKREGKTIGLILYFSYQAGICQSKWNYKETTGISCQKIL